MADSACANDQIPYDPRTVLIVTFFCLTTAATLPPDQLQSFTDLFGLALTILLRR